MFGALSEANFQIEPFALKRTSCANSRTTLTSSFPTTPSTNRTFTFALALHRNLLQSTAAVDRGVRRARFMGVLRGQNRPAVLIEGGYLTNPAEAQSIAEPGYRSRLAGAVADALGLALR
jgi:N-acetylmuramoyl-L-alanine amidase